MATARTTLIDIVNKNPSDEELVKAYQEKREDLSGALYKAVNLNNTKVVEWKNLNGNVDFINK